MWTFQQVQKTIERKSIRFSSPKTKLLSQEVNCLQNHIQKYFYTIGRWTKLKINKKIKKLKQSSAIWKPYYTSIKRSLGTAEITNNVENLNPLQIHADEIMIFAHNSM